MKAKGLTATVVFEGSAINRDEKLAGNIASIKKLSRSDGTYSFMSRAFVRHHLFETLHLLSDWQAAPVAVPQGQPVIQFEFPNANIITYPEIDLFGFMNTSVLGLDLTVTRKAPLGITKAISLEPWQADMAFYANHDMVRRAQAQGLGATPNPFSKEEHYSYYRISFTLDLYRLGYQDIFMKAIPDNFKAWVVSLQEATPVEVDDVREFRKVLPENATWYKVQCGGEERYGLIGLAESKEVGRITFALNKNEHKKRVRELMTVLKNGLVMHSSTEDYGLVPVFFVAGVLKVPVPVFNSSVVFHDGCIDAQRLTKALNNEYVLKAWCDGSLPLNGEASTRGEPNRMEPWPSIDVVLDAIY